VQYGSAQAVFGINVDLRTRQHIFFVNQKLDHLTVLFPSLLIIMSRQEKGACQSLVQNCLILLDR